MIVYSASPFRRGYSICSTRPNLIVLFPFLANKVICRLTVEARDRIEYFYAVTCEPARLGMLATRPNSALDLYDDLPIVLRSCRGGSQCSAPS